MVVGIGKDDKPLDEDARPIVVGEFWRRVAGKVVLLVSLTGWLKPHQVAVGVKAWAEVIVHSLRRTLGSYYSKRIIQLRLTKRSPMHS